jgi:hypothetical protein
MRYWAYFAAKLLVAGAFFLVLRKAVEFVFFPHPTKYLNVATPPFAHDLPYTFTMLGLALAAAGVLWLIVWDQRYRCRTCLRRLRMPVVAGSWTHVLLIGTPRTEYICPYGHGTLKVAELQITGANPDWQPHEDIWTELRALEESKK